MIGASLPRKEDGPLLTGRGRFVDDLVRPGMAFLGVVRSPHAHARLIGISTDAARAAAGVLGVFTAADLPELAQPIPPYRAKRKFRAFAQPVIASTTVRHVGEVVAAVVASDPNALADALELVAVDYATLPAVASSAAAVAPGAPRVHDAWPDNIAHVARTAIGTPAPAHLVVAERFCHPRVSAMPIETRGALAYRESPDMLVVAGTTQHPYHLREVIAHFLGRPEESVRVLSPDVGGSFGAKGQIYAEEVLVAVLAERLDRPVKWIESRTEHFIATSHDREQVHDIRAGFAADGRIVSVEDRYQADFGAYPVQEDGVTANTATHLCAAYTVPALSVECTNVVTHKTFSAAYRAAGRPEAAFVMERTLDIAARRLGIDPAEIRRRNLIRPEAMPYRPGLVYKDGAEVAVDTADFPESFAQLLRRFDYVAARAQQRAHAHPTTRLGIGLACYAQGTGLGPYEGANVRVDPSGKVYVHLGTSSQGQSHATTLAQICAAELGVDFDDVVIVGGDTQALAYGFGPFASRIAANAGPAIAHAARLVRAKAVKVAATMLEVAEAEIRVTGGRAHLVGVPAHGVPLGEVAKTAIRAKALMPDPGLNACTYFNPATVTWSFGAQAVLVSVDIETCAVELLRYAAVHDCGRPINPAVVAGQLHGGIAQGIGAALGEALVYTEDGQLLGGSLLDYAIPRADDLPLLDAEPLAYPSAINDLGIKGVGESGTIAPGAAIANAIEDALAEFDVTIRALPVTPGRLFELLRAATRA